MKSTRRCAEKRGLWDAVASRAEAQTLRLSMIFALLDGLSTIDEAHLRAALAVWRYPIYCAFLSGGADIPTYSENFGLQMISPTAKTKMNRATGRPV